ncbi:MAG: NADH-quinone oxidoreductase subunit C, partial [Fibrobacter sp.]|nr:NADH-quinone oxidoreductase subunit C [Fibrobacter sp.]
MKQSCELNASLLQDENILNEQFAVFENCQGITTSSVPLITEQAFRNAITEAFKNGYAVSALYAVPESDIGKTVFAVLSNPATSKLYSCKCRLQNTTWESLVDKVPSVHLFEREMAEQHGITLINHPWPKPVRYGDKDSSGNKSSMPKNAEFYRVEGDDIHEVAVGPVHAGIIEPGHFRFQCHGENVLHLEIALGYQHRGIESKLAGG